MEDRLTFPRSSTSNNKVFLFWFNCRLRIEPILEPLATRLPFTIGTWFSDMIHLNHFPSLINGWRPSFSNHRSSPISSHCQPKDSTAGESSSSIIVTKRPKSLTYTVASFRRLCFSTGGHGFFRFSLCLDFKFLQLV